MCGFCLLNIALVLANRKLSTATGDPLSAGRYKHSKLTSCCRQEHRTLLLANSIAFYGQTRPPPPPSPLSHLFDILLASRFGQVRYRWKAYTNLYSSLSLVEAELVAGIKWIGDRLECTSIVLWAGCSHLVPLLVMDLICFYFHGLFPL